MKKWEFSNHCCLLDAFWCLLTDKLYIYLKGHCCNDWWIKRLFPANVICLLTITITNLFFDEIWMDHDQCALIVIDESSMAVSWCLLFSWSFEYIYHLSILVLWVHMFPGSTKTIICYNNITKYVSIHPVVVFECYSICVRTLVNYVLFLPTKTLHLSSLKGYPLRHGSVSDAALPHLNSTGQHLATHWKTWSISSN